MDFRAFEIGKRYKVFKGMNGSKLYEADGCLFLVISYDDMQDEEANTFGNAAFEIVFKTFGMVSLFTFKFCEHIVDAPFDPFVGNMIWDEEVPLIVLVFESSSGELIVKRETVLPDGFCAGFKQLMAEWNTRYMETYRLGEFNQKIREIYDNHVIDEIYELPGERELRCFV